jgi:hypothetical protein
MIETAREIGTLYQAKLAQGGGAVRRHTLVDPVIEPMQIGIAIREHGVGLLKLGCFTIKHRIESQIE